MIRLGRISYVNMAPVFHRLEAEVEEVTASQPSWRAGSLAGEVDVAPIPSIEWARNAAQLRLLPRLCVSSEGAVDSIQLVSPKPIDRILIDRGHARERDLGRAGADPLPEREHVPFEQRADAKLLIGDAALRSAFEDPTPAPRPRAPLDGAHGPADGLRRLGLRRPAA